VHPAAWLTWVTCAAGVTLTTTNPFYLLPVAAAAFVVQAACALAGPARRAFWIFVRFGVVAMVTRTALVLFGPVDGGSVAAALLEGLRLAVLLAVFGTFNGVLEPARILRLAPSRFHEPALAATLALSIAPRMIDAVAKVREAQRVRGLTIGRLRSLPALAVPVLETGMEEAVTLAESMDSRGHGRGRRTAYRPESWDAAAIAVVAASVIALVAFAAAGRAGTGDLAPSTFPLMWPDASPALVGAVLLLAVPAVRAPSLRAPSLRAGRP